MTFEMPSKVLLVDDERDFVQTLSERLIMRDMGSAVAYDGESALTMIADEEPEVMILDLKMPGIDGIEVLRQVKIDQPGYRGHRPHRPRHRKGQGSLHGAGRLRLPAETGRYPAAQPDPDEGQREGSEAKNTEHNALGGTPADNGLSRHH